MTSIGKRASLPNIKLKVDAPVVSPTLVLYSNMIGGSLRSQSLKSSSKTELRRLLEICHSVVVESPFHLQRDNDSGDQECNQIFAGNQTQANTLV